MCRWKQRHSLSSPAASATAAESSVATALAALPGPASANTSEAAEASGTSCFATVDVSTDPDQSCEDNSGLQLLSAVAAELHVAATSTVSFRVTCLKLYGKMWCFCTILFQAVHYYVAQAASQQYSSMYIAPFFFLCVTLTTKKCAFHLLVEKFTYFASPCAL